MNILLLQLKRIGDLILTAPVSEVLRKKFPEAKITLVVSNENDALLPAIPYAADRALVIQRKWSDLALFRAIHREKFDYCIDFTGNDRSALLAFLSGAPKRISSNWSRVRSKIRGRAYNEFVPDRVSMLHTLDFHLSLLEPLGIHNVSPALRLDLPRAAHESADKLLRQARIDDEFVIFHPGSARAEKFWDAQRWADVIHHLRSSQRFPIVLTGGSRPLEQAHLADIKTKLRQPIVDFTGSTDLLVLAALISRARLLVTIDSAPMHLAAATHTPQVVLFGPTNPFHWRPRQSPALILQGKSTIPMVEFAPKRPPLPMNDISTGAVIDAMNALLSAPAAHVS